MCKSVEIGSNQWYHILFDMQRTYIGEEYGYNFNICDSSSILSFFWSRNKAQKVYTIFIGQS